MHNTKDNIYHRMSSYLKTNFKYRRFHCWDDSIWTTEKNSSHAINWTLHSFSHWNLNSTNSPAESSNPENLDNDSSYFLSQSVPSPIGLPLPVLLARLISDVFRTWLCWNSFIPHHLVLMFCQQEWSEWIHLYLFMEFSLRDFPN